MYNESLFFFFLLVCLFVCLFLNTAMKVITLMYKVPIVTKLSYKEHDRRSGGV